MKITSKFTLANSGHSSILGLVMGINIPCFLFVNLLCCLDVDGIFEPADWKESFKASVRLGYLPTT